MDLNTLRKKLIICLFILIFLSTFIVCTLSYYNLKSQQYTHTIKQCTSKEYIPKTGDLVLLQYKSAGLHNYPNGIKQIPTHCGIIWVQNDTVFVMEATKFDTIKNFWVNHKERGVRLILLSDLLNSVDSFLSIRPLLKGSITLDNLQIKEWALNLEFEPHVSTHMNLINLIVIGLGPMLPLNINKFLGKLSGLNDSTRTSVFCSEFISLLLHRLGHLKYDFKDHWSISPLSLTSDIKIIDMLCPNLKWGNEISFICLN